jgi:hypothetical protein
VRHEPANVGEERARLETHLALELAALVGGAWPHVVRRLRGLRSVCALVRACGARRPRRLRLPRLARAPKAPPPLARTDPLHTPALLKVLEGSHHIRTPVCMDNVG